MSIIRKQKTTEEYIKKLEILPQSTRNNRIDAVKKFQKFCKDKHNSTSEEICKELLIIKKQDEEEYIDTLYELLQDWINEYTKKLHPNTIKTIFTNVRSYLYYFGIKTDSQDVRQLLSLPRIQKEEKYPLKHEELRRIVEDQVRNPVRKALYLACSSSGMRMGEAVQITKSDLEFKERIQINIRPEYTKTQTGRSVFISKECEEVLQKYLDELKDDDLIFYRGLHKTKSRVSGEDIRLSEVLSRLGLNMKYSSNGRHKITTHSFRAFFFTQAVRKHGENYAHKLTGHGGYLMQYDRMTDEEKLKMYIELEPDLVVFDTTKQKLEIEKLKMQQNLEIEEMKAEMENLKNHLAKQGMEILGELKKSGKIVTLKT
jgi:integrase